MRKLMLGLGFLISFILMGVSAYFMWFYQPSAPQPPKEPDVVVKEENDLSFDQLRNMAFMMVSSARNVVTTKAYKIPYAAIPSVTTPNGCYILWNDLNMESNTLPVGGNVNPTKSGVLITNDGTGNVTTYTVYLLNEAGDTGIPGVVREGINQSNVIINNKPTPMMMNALDVMDQSTGFAKACSV